MTIDYHPHPEQFRGTGTVFIAWEADEEGYRGYWDSLPDGSPKPLEAMPRTRSIREVVEWGRRRAPRVLIRPESDSGEYYWAGVGEPQGGDTGLKQLVL
ncbi:MAG: hypothetical protein M3P18_22430 [Actinomycetota bacterium]|nr:hypothetical protein [Actinomycetota bacterium]